MKSMKKILGIALMLVLLGSGTSWGSLFTINDTDGNWWSAGGTLTYNLGTLSTSGYSGGGQGLVTGTLDTDSATSFYNLFANYSGTPGTPGITIDIEESATYWPYSNVFDLHNDLYVAVEADLFGENSLMFFAGDQSAYGYFGIEFSSLAGLTSFLGAGLTDLDSFNWSSLFCDCEQELTLGVGVEVIAGKECNVPIPGAVWLLGSGLLGLVGIRRRKS